MIGNFRLPVSVASAQETLDTPITYVRPADWLAMPSVVAGNQKFVGLHAVYDGASNFCAMNCASNYTVDWGDGTVENFAANVQANHNFDYNYAGFVGTETSEGFRQSIVTVTPQATYNLTKVDLAIKHNQTGLVAYPQSGWLDIKLAGSLISNFNCGYNVVKSLMLKEVEMIGTFSFTSVANMYYGCTSLVKTNLFSTTNVTNFSYFYYNCYSIEEIPFYDTQNATNVQSFANNCYSLIEVHLYNFEKVTTATFAFDNCRRLRYLPLFNFLVLQGCASFCSNCYNLLEAPFWNLVGTTVVNNMFQNCYKIKTFPLYVLSSVTRADFMHYNNFSCKEFPFYNLVANTTANSMFYGCIANSYPLYNLANCTDFSYMHYGNTNLIEATFYNTVKGISFIQMYYGCSNLEYAPAYDLHAATNITAMFQLTLIRKMPAFVFYNSINANNIFYQAFGLREVPSIDGALTNNTANGYGGNTSLYKWRMYGFKDSQTFTNCSFSKTELELIFTNAGIAQNNTKYIDVAGNYGAVAAVSKTACGTTSGSDVVTQSNTSSLAVGMLVTGIGIDEAKAVTFQDTGDTVTRVAHGLVNGNTIVFNTIVSTTGIVINTRYFVVSATADTFKVSASHNGTALLLTTNGSGTMTTTYGSHILSIVPNVSFTLDKPASATGSVTLSCRVLDTSIAILKGWSITG